MLNKGVFLTAQEIEQVMREHLIESHKATSVLTSLSLADYTYKEHDLLIKSQDFIEDMNFCTTGAKDLAKCLEIPYGYLIKISEDLALRNLRTRTILDTASRRVLYSGRDFMIRGIIPESYNEVSLVEAFTEYSKISEVSFAPMREITVNEILYDRALLFFCKATEIKEFVHLGLVIQLSELGAHYRVIPALFFAESGSILPLITSYRSKYFRISQSTIDTEMIRSMVNTQVIDARNSTEVVEVYVEKLQEKLSTSEWENLMIKLKIGNLSAGIVRDLEASGPLSLLEVVEFINTAIIDYDAVKYLDSVLHLSEALGVDILQKF